MKQPSALLDSDRPGNGKTRQRKNVARSDRSDQNADDRLVRTHTSSAVQPVQNFITNAP